LPRSPLRDLCAKVRRRTHGRRTARSRSRLVRSRGASGLGRASRGVASYPPLTMPINETHDPNLRSWVESANDPTTDFPIQNLPLAIGERDTPDGDGAFAHLLLIPIGDHFLD